MMNLFIFFDRIRGCPTEAPGMWPWTTTCAGCGGRISVVKHQGRDTKVNPIAEIDRAGFYTWEPHYCGGN